MKDGVLVEGDNVVGMFEAEDIAAPAAMMSAGEEGKGHVAGGMVAMAGRRVGLLRNC